MINMNYLASYLVDILLHMSDTSPIVDGLPLTVAGRGLVEVHISWLRQPLTVEPKKRKKDTYPITFTESGVIQHGYLIDLEKST